MLARIVSEYEKERTLRAGEDYAHESPSDIAVADSAEADDFDNPWKAAIERHFSSFLHFFFPAAHAEIDWTHAPVWLDQELRNVARDAKPGKRIVDKLAHIKRTDGEPAWVYIHLEIQGQQQENFSKRMFVYHYRLYDRYEQPIASLALLTDDHPRWRPERFGYRSLGCELALDYPVAKLTDWVRSEHKLADDHNPFALLTLAHLATRATRHDPSARKQEKWQLLKQLYRKGWTAQEVLDFYQVLDWMMRLPKELEQQLRQDVRTLEGELAMRYVTSFERLAMEEGIQQGQSRMLTRILARRFGTLPPWAEKKLMKASTEELECWLDSALEADSLPAALGAPADSH